MSKERNGLQWSVIGCGGLIIFAFISVSLVFRSFTNSWDSQLATLIATDDSIAAFGDGAHAVPIDPDNILSIGESSPIFGIEIALDNAGFIKSAENVSGSWEYWFVEFSGKSIVDEIQYGINPNVEAQLQYLHGNSYVWSLDEFELRQCNYGNVVKGFEPGDSFQCRFTYLVPADERNLYWVYARTDNGTDGAYEERYAVFQIR